MPDKGDAVLDYSNPEIPEGINVSPRHPLAEFAWLAGGVLAILIVAITTLELAASHLARFIPFSTEQQLLDRFRPNFSSDPSKKADLARQRWLQDLADRLARHMDLPAGMKVHVHYRPNADEVNAFATLGGHIMIDRGLLEKLKDEQALAMVMAHEIAHIRHRDPIMGLGRGVVVGLALTSLAGLSGSDLLPNLAGNVGQLESLKFSREQESAADLAALEAIEAEYGDIGGVDRLFAVFETLEANSPHKRPGFFSDHPLTEQRLADLHAYARSHGWRATGPANPLPASLLPSH